MLLRFGVSNYRSIRNYCEMSFIASGAIKDKGPALLGWNGVKTQVLPALILYGANAAGKSSMHLAVGAMRGHVINSFRKLEAGAKIPRDYYALDVVSHDRPTRFDCDFVIDDVRYHYGFEFDGNAFNREWLYSFPEGYKRLLFNRDSENPDIEFGKHLRGENRSIEKLTRPNSLYLSAAAQGAHAQLTGIYNFFSTKIFGMGAALNDAAIQRRIGEGADPRLVAFLRYADTGISDMQVRTEPENVMFKKTFKSVRASLIAELGEGAAAHISEEPAPQAQVVFFHGGEDGESYELPFTRESRGTRRLASIVMTAFAALDQGGVLFIDEIDASLHTLLSLKLVSLFLDADTNPHGAQIVATTHDTNILCAGKLRRDQIWFAEKDQAGSTNVYPLTDISTRNSDNLEKGYLQGRFGAVPYLGNIPDLFGVRDDAA